ncbi:MAG: hypothetical protein IVW51_00505 [Thermaceae bacterium]|nr:hypothetical protein [Thermaceae bacterium]
MLGTAHACLFSRPHADKRASDPGGTSAWPNPIEGVFNKLKTLVRQAKARSRELLDLAIGSAFQAITAADARGFFSRAGYLLSQ